MDKIDNISDYFKKENFQEIIKNFFELYLKKREVYNEFSFQHELGIYLRTLFEKDGYKVEFERNAKDFGIVYDDDSSDEAPIKKEIDICIYKGSLKDNNSEKYAIELKFPLNKQYPEQMFSFIKDVRFMQELVNQKKFKKTYCIVLVQSKDKSFYEGEHIGTTNIDIYKYFRNNPTKKELLTGEIKKPTGKDKNKYPPIKLGNKKYPFTWEDCKIKKDETITECKYYIIESK